MASSSTLTRKGIRRQRVEATSLFVFLFLRSSFRTASVFAATQYTEHKATGMKSLSNDLTFNKVSLTVTDRGIELSV